MNDAIYKCEDCNMPLSQVDYHPYAACLMFKSCKDADIVKINLDSIIAHALQYHSREEELLIQLKQKWQPIETAPKDGTRILLRRVDWPDGIVIGKYLAQKWLADGGFWALPLDWQPLPER